MLCIRDHLLPLLHAASPHPSPLHHRTCFLLLSTTTYPSPPPPFSLEDYLVTTCGLDPAQARKASQKALAGASLRRFRLDSASNPDAVLAQLSGVGLACTDIVTIVNSDPLILNYKASTIGDRLLAIRDRFCLFAPQIARLLLIRSSVLHRSRRNVGPILEFFTSFFGSFEMVLVAVKRNNRMLTSSLDRVNKPNIAQLQQCGLSVRDIA
ncbi:hypothetical protein PR202_ga17679 [Eleusine coracana subsp. coracana]|uniref:Uncharacterized protein n=1 Tax=Eleusine coracana subsp. coracana TaxID=191504 RepID=A0AAV5CQF3_ELECO|nr:hypothetical protein PR202_ga17432 [Eleusine coracana subsp. coracana]GJN00493.1 hypothetical protein PR202_ga17679 [Eleusine coracana subsp. coracana]